MASIDNRVVSISFDNAAFQKNVEDTIRSLDTLKGKLNFESANNAFSDLNKASQTVNLSSIASAVDSISSKFSAMGAVAFSILDNLTTKALGVSQNLVSSFSFTPVVGGFQEYETNMNSIQTILANTASKGTNLKDVNAALDELNNYSDQTIYNFSEMARNIGTFTAAGVDLKTSTESIKGIANLAAVSGSSSQQASVAMYQLSQAIASGTVRLIDWNSVQNAGMGGEVFQRALFETGKTLGTIADTPIDMTFEQWTAAGNTFRGSLEDNWLTSEVLTQTLQGFTGDLTEAQLLSMGYTQAQAVEIMKMGVIAQDAATKVKTLTQLVSTTKEVLGSGWAQSFRIIVGDFEEARELFTGINNVLGNFINESANARNQLLTDWKNLGGRTQLIEGLSNAFKALVSIIRPISKAFREIFPKKTAEELFNLTVRFNEFTKKLIVGSVNGERIKNVFRGIFSIFKIGIEIVRNIFNVFQRLFGALFSFSGSSILKFFSDIGRGLFSLKRQLVDGKEITTFFERLTSSIINLANKLNLDPITKKLDEFKQKINSLFTKDSSNGSGGSEETITIFDRIRDAINRVISGAESFGSVIGKAFAAIGRFAQSVKEKLSEVWDALTGIFTGENVDRAIKGLGIGLFAGILAVIKGWIDNGLVGLIGGKDLVRSITRVFGGLEGVLTSLQTNIKADALLKLGKALALLTISIIALSFVDPVKVGLSLTALAAGIAVLTKAVITLAKTAVKKETRLEILALAVSLGILATSLIALSIALVILSRIDPVGLAAGMTAIVAFLYALENVSKDISKNALGFKTAGIGIGFIAIGMILLALAVKAFSILDYDTIAKGLGTIAVALYGIVYAVKLLPEKADLVNVGGGIILLAIGMIALAAAIKLLAMINILDTVKGLATIGGALVVMGLSLKKFPEKDMVRLSLAILGISVAMVFMAESVKKMAVLSIGELIKALATFVALFAIFKYALKDLDKDGLAGGFALLLLVFGLERLTKVFKDMEQVSFYTIAKSLFAFGVVFGLLAGAAYIAQKLVVGLGAIGWAALFIGGAVFLAGLGIKFFAEGLLTLAESGSKGLKFFVENLDTLLTLVPKVTAALGKALYSFIIAFLEGAPELLKVLGTVFDSILDLIIQRLPKVVSIIIQVIQSVIKIIRETVPDLIILGYELLLSFLSGLSENIKDVVDTVSQIMIKFYEALKENIPEIIKAGVEFLVAFLGGLTENLKEIAPAISELVAQFIIELGKYAQTIVEAGADFLVKLITGIGNSVNKIVEAGTNVMISFLQGISNNVQRLIDAGFAIVIDFLNGVANSIRTNRNQLLSAGYNILDAIFGGVLQRVVGVTSWFTSLAGQVFGWVGNTVSTLASRGYDIIVGFWNGIQDRITGVTNWFRNLGTSITTWVGNLVGTLVNTGKNIIEGLWNGIYDKATNWLKGKLGWLTDLLPGWVKDALGISSPSKVFAEIGVQTMTGLMVGMNKEQGNLKVAASELANSVVDNFDPSKEDMARNLNSTIKYILDNLDSIGEFNPTITPVLDLSGARRDLTAFNGLFTTAPVSPSLSYNRAQTISEAEAQRLIATSTETIGGGDINFNQTINAPTALSTNDIYRQTRSQIAMAKKELSLL